MHDKCDPPGRNAIIKYVKREWGLDAENNPNKYAVDLIIKKDNEVIGYAEIETRRWNYLPFNTIHIPKRKDKLFNDILPTYYFVVSRFMVRAWYCNTKDILNSPVFEIPNTSLSQDEYFYDVDLKHFTEITL